MVDSAREAAESMYKFNFFNILILKINLIFFF